MKIQKRKYVQLIIDGLCYSLLIMVIITAILVAMIPMDIARKFLFMIGFIVMGYVLIKQAINPKPGEENDG